MLPVDQRVDQKLLVIFLGPAYFSLCCQIAQGSEHFYPWNQRYYGFRESLTTFVRRPPSKEVDVLLMSPYHPLCDFDVWIFNSYMKWEKNNLV